MAEEVDRNVLRKYELHQKLGKGVRRERKARKTVRGGGNAPTRTKTWRERRRIKDASDAPWEERPSRRCRKRRTRSCAAHAPAGDAKMRANGPSG